ncbi:MAG: response regulator [Bacteroidia bacterium]
MRTLIVDDETLARQELRYLLKDFQNIEVIEEAANADDAKEKIEELRPDLIFLDINMPVKSGFDLLEELDFMPCVIFATAYDQFAIKAFEANALDYLLKPIREERLSKAILKVTDELSSRQSEQNQLNTESKVFIKDGEKCYFVNLTEIYLIESVGNYARLSFEKKSPLLHKSLNQLEEKLPGAVFFRANRQQIININYIQDINAYFKGGLQIELKSGDRVEVSNRQAVKFKELMSL